MASRWRRSLAVLLALSAALGPGAVAANDTLYRYRNADNIVVIDFSIPPEFAAKGYEVITPEGRVVETVPPSDALPSQAEEGRRQQQQRLDQFILRSYSTVHDVHNARDRQLALLTREIEILTNNIAEYQRRFHQLRERAASQQASGSAPPRATEAMLVGLREQEETAARLLAERRAQHRELTEKYQDYARRLVELKGDSALAGAAEAADQDGESGPANPATDE